MSKIRNSKFKNTGILFELLTKQITLEILNNSPKENAREIVREFFASRTELNKELKLYNLLLNEKYNSENKAEKFIDVVLEARMKIDEKKLSREKYNLVKIIKENFQLDNFLSSPITNYRVLASIHKLFEARKSDSIDIKDAFNSKYTIVEHISTKPIQSKSDKKDMVIETYKTQEKDLRMLTYKILVESFNKKYTNLNDDQKDLLREYINNVTNTTKFGDYYSTQLKNSITELHTLYTNITDTITKIKLKETINVLKKQRIGKKISDNQVSALMISYELIKEIKNVG